MNNASEDFFPYACFSSCYEPLWKHDDQPDIDRHLPSTDHDHLDCSDKATILLAAADILVHTKLSYRPQRKRQNKAAQTEYAKELLTMGLLCMPYEKGMVIE